MAKKERKKKVVKFKSVQQNILIPQGKPYFAAHYTGSTIRSGDYNEARVSRENQSGFSPNDSLGLESMFPRIASDFFKVQIPKAPPPLPIQVHQIDRREYNMAHDTVRPSYTSGLQVAREPEYVTPLPATRQMPDISEFIEPVRAEKPRMVKAREEDLPEDKPLTKTQQKKIAAAEKRAEKEAEKQRLIELGIPTTKTEQKKFEAQQRAEAKAREKAAKEKAAKDSAKEKAAKDAAKAEEAAAIPTKTKIIKKAKA
jgi:hypothetical protein